MIQTDNIFEAFKDLNILVIGDVMIDRYINGKVNRISPEAPVPVVNWETTENRLGGAANVALNLKALGANPYLLSIIGDDENGEVFKQLLPTNGLSSRGILSSKQRSTSVKTRIIASNQHLLRVDRETTNDLSAQEQKMLLTELQKLLELKEIQAILLQDYNKGVLSHKVIREIILESIKRDIPTAVDPKYKNFWAYKHISLFKPNLREVQQQLNFEVEPTLSSLEVVSKHIKNKLGNRYTIITLSEKGIFLDDKGKCFLIPTQPRAIADVCGAGDTVISVLSLGLALDYDMKEIVNLANLAGGIVCEEVGVVPINKEKLRFEYQNLGKQNDFLKFK